MEFTAKQIADVIGGRVEGDENAKIHTFAKIEEGKEGTITFLSNPKYTHFIYETKASIVLINNDVELEHPVSATLIRVPNAYECVAKLMQMYAASLPKKKGIDPLAFVSKTAEIGKDVYIGPFTYVGEGVKIGDGCLIYPHVTIYDGCKIGNNVTIHAGAVIGADGFGFAPNQEGYDKIPQMGIVVIEDNVSDRVAQGRQARQPYPSGSQLRNWREHCDVCPSRYGWFYQDWCLVHGWWTGWFLRSHHHCRQDVCRCTERCHQQYQGQWRTAHRSTCH